MSGYIPGTSPTYVNNVRRSVEIETLENYVVIKDNILRSDIGLPVVLTFDQYRALQQREEFENFWQEQVVKNFTEADGDRRGTGGINLEVPVKIKSRAFRKIFGGSSVGLTVTGDISIQTSLRRENRSEVRTAVTRGANTNFRMQQTQRFTVTGKIGDKVTVNVDQDSERAFEFDNNVRLNYQGYDDEIIQRIEAGNIALSLPGTRYVTFSGKNSGLFGIKTQMALGNLKVTAIASQQKGESQKLSLTGGAAESTQKIPDYQYLSQTYFFLDTLYRKNYPVYDREGNHFFDPALVIQQDSIEVYKAASGYENKFSDKAIRGVAIFNYPTDRPIMESDTAVVKGGSVERGFFIRLEKSEYYVENNLGFIRFKTRLSDDEIIGVAYKRANGQTLGFLNFSQNDSTTANETIVLKLIKPRNPIPSHESWDLAWKHAYSLGGRNIDPEGLQIKIFFHPPSGPDQETDGNGKRWIEVFGLDQKDQNGARRPDGEIDRDNNIIDLARGELHFPDLQPFDPETYVVDDTVRGFLPDELRTPVIYDTTNQNVINAQSKFYISVKSKNRSTNYNLGFNVIEGSEVVTLNGEVLRKDIDYTIDYFSGNVTILDERASSPSANLDISFERNQLFQLEKKTILGSRAEYSLGGDSFIGGTFLYLNESTLEQKVRVGRGPMQNLVWDINSRLKFKPNFIGTAFNALPFVRANGETAVNFEGEIAQVAPTPNTLNNTRTGDSKGVAYIDDFEGSKKTTSLGILRRNWTQASVPADPFHSLDNMVNYIWYNPFGQVRIKDIYPERDLNPNVPNLTHVLTFELHPEAGPNIPNPKQDVFSWGGIMRALSPGFFDQSQTKFLEVMVQGDAGRLHIDLGLISEDVINNNGRLDSEDKKVNGIRDGILDLDEDVGIDGMQGPDPPTFNFPRDSVNAGFDFWDLNGNGKKDPREPWSYDDWLYSEADPFLYFQQGGSISGTENSANDEGGRRPDTEDINGNGSVDLSNDYFEYTFSLDKNSPDTTLRVGGNPAKNWRLFRIPLDNYSLKVGNPEVTQIEFVRIWVDSVTDFSRPILFSIADISLVGNDWKELGITPFNDFDMTNNLLKEQDSTFAVTVINTHENPGYSETLSEIGVQGEEDRITGVRAREQSLVLKATRLPGHFAGISQKSLFQGENYIHYDRIKMFVHGIDHKGTHMTPNSSSVEYFFRFGADVNNYYEYRAKIYPGWDQRNHMNVFLQDFTRLKKDSTFFDARSGVFVNSLGDSASLRVKGNPSLTNVKTLIIGIKNLDANVPFDGEVWFNELRLSNVQQDKGVAMRFRADMRIADFASINGEVERKDADFHNVATRFGTGNNRVSGSFNANIKVEKMLPRSWGVSMPLTVNFRRSNSTPKYFPGQDRLVSNAISDAELETVRSKTNQNGFNFSFRRKVKSKNFFLNHTIDKMSFSLGKATSRSENPTTKFSNRRSWTGNFDYGIDFGRNNYISPLKWVPGLPLLKKVKNTKFYYTPQNIAFKVNGTKTDQRSQNRIQNSDKEADISKTETFNMIRSVRSSMKVFESLTLDFNRAHTADMRHSSFADFFKSHLEDINITQSFSARYNPRIFTWLNNSFNYTSNYRFNNNLQQPKTGRSAGVNTNKSAQFTLRIKEFTKSVFGSGKKAARRRGRRPPRRRPGKESEEPGKGKTQNKQKEEKEGKGFNPLRSFGDFLGKFKDITFNYAERKNINQFGLQAGAPSLGFQFGFSDTTHVGTVEDLSTNNITFNKNKTYSVGSGIAFGRAIDFSLRFQHSDQRSETTNITGSNSDSWLKVGKFDMPFPEWTVSINGLSKIPGLSKLFNNFTFTHNFSGQKDVTWSGDPNSKTQETITTNFRPLGKIDFRFKNGFSGNVQINRARSLSQSFVGGVGARRTTNTDFAVTANYSKRSGFRLPFWPFNKAELKNSIDFSFTFTANTVVTEQRLGMDQTTAKFDEQDRTSRWAVRPSLTYSFSNQVRGGAFVEIGRNRSKRLGTTSVQEFGFNVNISIRGT
ncbi:MAG: cell surface protein SprA [bacterium]